MIRLTSQLITAGKRITLDLGKMKFCFHEESFILAENTQSADIANSLTGDTLSSSSPNEKLPRQNQLFFRPSLLFTSINYRKGLSIFSQNISFKLYHFIDFLAKYRRKIIFCFSLFFKIIDRKILLFKFEEYQIGVSFLKSIAKLDCRNSIKYCKV